MAIAATLYNARMYGTNAERLALVTTDLGTTEICFYETDTNSEYEWKGSEWVQVGTGGAANVIMGNNSATVVQTATATATGTGIATNGGRATFQAVATGDGTLTATVLIQVSNNDTNYLTAATINLSGTTPQQEGFVLDAPWKYVRSNVTVFSQSAGTNKSLTVTMGN